MSRWSCGPGRAAHERAVLAQMAADLECLPIDDAVWASARAMAQICRAAGIIVPATDRLIAACADHHGAQLLDRDAHFAEIAAARKKSAK